MEIQDIQFGEIVINGQRFTEDIVIDRGVIIPRDKSQSRKQKMKYGHTPLTVQENIPWNCRTLVIGSGMYGKLPISDEVLQLARQKGVEVMVVPTPRIKDYLSRPETNFVIHLTC